MTRYQVQTALEQIQKWTDEQIEENPGTIRGVLRESWVLIGNLSKGTRGRWIDPAGALPVEGVYVLLWLERDAWTDTGKPIRKREFGVGWQYGGRFHVDGCTGVKVVGWMPLPDPPQEREAR